MNLPKEQIDAIKKDAAENWAGNLELAAAAHIHGAGVVTYGANQMLPWFDTEKIKSITDQLKSSPAGGSSPATAAPAVDFRFDSETKKYVKV
jgi:hypothetical protein